MSLGIALREMGAACWWLVMAMATGLAVSQAGLVAFVGLVSTAPRAPLRSRAARLHAGGERCRGGRAPCSPPTSMARTLVAPQELPVGVVTAVLGGSYLLWLLHRRSWR